MSREPSPVSRLLIFAWIAAAGARQPVAGETLRYEFEIGDHEEAVFEIPFEVVHPGRVGAEISWAGSRILSFRLQGPGTPPVRVVRSGPSPQRMQATATEHTVAEGGQWKMSVRALPARGKAIATLVVETPEPAPVPEGPLPAATPPPVAPVHTEVWARPRAAPPSASVAQQRIFDTIEAFRSLVVLASGELRPDACAWQASFLQYAVRIRDGGMDVASAAEPGKHVCARRFVSAIGQIDWLRTTDDPEVRGGAPEDADERIAWRARRADKVRPIEHDLDQVFALLRAERCPDLAGELWPSRLLACATGCERHFEERSRIGEEAVAYAELARSEWPAIVAAAAVLDALTGKAAAPEPSHEP